MFIDKKYNLLTPIVHVSGAWWACKCDCGNFTVAEVKKLIDGVRKSCGCLNGLGRNRKTEPRRITLSREDQGFKEVKYGYTHRTKREFRLTEEEFRTLVKSNCFYCGKEPANQKILSAKENDNSKKYIFLYNGIDRQNNNIGYDSSNCVPCCWMCNELKGSLELEKFLEWIQRLIKHNTDKKII